MKFYVGQCKRQFQAKLCTASMYNVCSTKTADEFQRLLNIETIPIESCEIVTSNGHRFHTHQKIIVPITLYADKGRKLKYQVHFHIISTIDTPILGYHFIFQKKFNMLNSKFLSIDNCKVQIHHEDNEQLH